MSSSTPIRIGFVGASSSSARAWANNAHLPYLLKSPHYQIVALLNSSVASARKAIEKFKLPPSTAAYASVDDLAADPNVDLVVISVNVQTHYELAIPVLKAGKDIFVEWPLGSNLEQAEHLTRLAHEHNVKRAIVGLQARGSTAVRKVKELIDSGVIGKVTGTNAVGGYEIMGETISEWLKFVLDKKSGGNFVAIPFAHFIDAVTYVFQSEFETIHAALYNHRPTVNIVSNSDKSVIVEANAPKDTPDQIVFSGRLATGQAVAIDLRSANPIKGRGLSWIINGTKGDIEMASIQLFPQLSPGTVKLYVHTGEDRDVTEEIDVATEPVPELQGLSLTPGASGETGGMYGSPAARAIGAVYEAYRLGNEEQLASFEHAVVRHRLVDSIFNGKSTYKTTY